MGRVAMLVVLIIGSLVGASMADRNSYWGWGWGWGSPKHKHVTQNNITVGGSSNWTFGFNYARWAFQHGIFYVNDTLVFKYEPPSANNSHPHSVYLLPDFWSFKKCDLKNAVKLANESQGAGDGFHYKLEKWQPYFFACGASNGFHCNNGTMKFFVLPQFRYWS